MTLALSRLLRVRAGFVAALIGCAALPVAAADPAELRFGYGYVGGSLLLEDNGRFSGRGSGLRLGLGERLHPRWGYELGVFHHDFDSEVALGGGNWREYGGRLEGLYYYTDHPRWMPYFALGGGLIRSKERFRNAQPPGGQWASNDVFGNVGVGLLYRWPAGRHDLGLRGDYRYRFFDLGDIPGTNSFEEHVFSVDLVMRFGARPPPASPSVLTDVPPAARTDGAAVPPSEPVVASGAMAHAPEAVAAASRPSWPVVEAIVFPYKSVELTDHARALLLQWAGPIAAALEARPGTRLVIVGHTDAGGSAAYNQVLSRQRAEAVAAYLRRQGVPGARIVIEGRGFEQPVASNEDDAGRARNRRAEIVFPPD